MIPPEQMIGSVPFQQAPMTHGGTFLHKRRSQAFSHPWTSGSGSLWRALLAHA